MIEPFAAAAILIIWFIWYHRWVLQPELQRFADQDRERAKVLSEHIGELYERISVVSRNVASMPQDIDRDMVETLSAFHEMRFLPALQLLASQRIDCAPPAVEAPKVVTIAKRSQLVEDEAIENLWDKVRSSQ